MLNVLWSYVVVVYAWFFVPAPKVIEVDFVQDMCVVFVYPPEKPKVVPPPPVLSYTRNVQKDLEKMKRQRVYHIWRENNRMLFGVS